MIFATDCFFVTIGWLGSTNGSPQRLQHLGASLRYDPSHPSPFTRIVPIAAQKKTANGDKRFIAPPG